jgi:hypothetical protein
MSLLYLGLGFILFVCECVFFFFLGGWGGDRNGWLKIRVYYINFACKTMGSSSTHI